MSTVAISQPALFPWQGMVEQLSICDIYIHHDDLQYPKQWFTNRVQIKTPTGQQWLTIPIEKAPFSILIKDVRIRDDGWREKHMRAFESNYAKAPHRDDALSMLDSVYSNSTDLLSELVIDSMYSTMEYFGFKDRIKSFYSSQMDPEGAKSDRVLWLVEAVGANRYITGHGALNYLEHEKFDAAGVAVEYMDYSKTEYPQLHGEFTPYVSSLDMIANLGRDAANYLHPQTRSWREMLPTRL